MRRRTRLRLQTVARSTLVWFVLPLAVLLAVRLLWGWEADRRMARVKDELRAQGVNIELPRVNVPDDQNPRAALAKAAELQRTLLSHKDQYLIEGDGSVPFEDKVWTDAERPLVQSILDRQQEAFRWIDVAAARQGPVPPAGTNYREYLAQWRGLAELLFLESAIEHGKGHEAIALQDMQRIYVLADVADHGGCGLDNDAAISLRSLMAVGVERLSPTLQLSAADGSRERAMVLLKALQDPASLASSAWNFEKDIGRTADFVEETVNLNGWWIRPLRDDITARAMGMSVRLVSGTRAADWPTAQKLFMAAAPPWRKITNLNELTFSYYGGGYVDMMHCFHGQSDLRAAAILLAHRLYAIDHGQAPGALDDLVPQYLAAVPVDPFSTTRAPLRFRIDPEGPTVWSVGENMSDEGGHVRFSATGIKLSRRYTSSLYQMDIIYGAAWLNAKPPTASPMSSPAPVP